MKNSISLQKLVFFLTAMGISLSPAAFGGTPSWFSPALFVYCGSIACLWSVSVVLSPGTQSASIRRLWFPLSLYSIAAAWCLFQATAPVPVEFSHGVWETAERITGHQAMRALSLKPEESLRGGGRLLAYAAVFLICYQLASAETRAIRLLTVIVVSASAYADFGMALEFNASETVLWFPRTFEHGNLSSTFPNRNAFASYAVLGILCACALLYRRRIRADDLAGTISRKVVAGVRYFVPRTWWAGIAVAILFAAILMSHSRGGVLIIAVTFMVFLGCAGRLSRYRRLAILSGIGLITLAVTAFLAAGDETAKRFDTLGPAAAERLEIDALTLKAIVDRPMLGTGLGTFSDVFPEYRSASIRPRIEFAHNSYLENALEMGIPATAAFYGALMWLFVGFVRRMWSARSSTPYPALGIAAMTAMAIHGAFDFSLQFPAVAITGSAIAGIAAAQSFARRIEDQGNRTVISDRRI